MSSVLDLSFPVHGHLVLGSYAPRAAREKSEAPFPLLSPTRCGTGQRLSAAHRVKDLTAVGAVGPVTIS